MKSIRFQHPAALVVGASLFFASTIPSVRAQSTGSEIKALDKELNDLVESENKNDPRPSTGTSRAASAPSTTTTAPSTLTRPQENAVLPPDLTEPETARARGREHTIVNGDAHITVKGDVIIEDRRGPHDEFDDYLDECRSVLKDLITIRREAKHLAIGRGDMGGAADELREGLQKAADDMRRRRGGHPVTFTLRAISKGQFLSDALEKSLRIIRKNDEIYDQVRYAYLDGIYGLIFQANRELDEAYYRQIIEECRRHNWPVDRWDEWEVRDEILPETFRGYFDSQRKLAMAFLDLQISQSPIQASNIVELAMDRATAHVAADLLVRSPLRRGYCSAVDSLDSIESSISRWMRNPRWSAWEQREIIRSELSRVRDHLNTLTWDCGCHGRDRR